MTTAQWNEILPSFDTPCSIPTVAAELRFRLKDIAPWIPAPIFNVILASSQAFSGFAHNTCRFETACIVHDRCFNVRDYLAPRKKINQFFPSGDVHVFNNLKACFSIIEVFV